jgi:dsRNA-specific ribonuclease
MTLPSFSQHLPPKFTTMRPPGLGGMSSQSLNKGRLSLPELSGDLSLEVFTHRSVPRASQTNAKWGDNTRLAVLGEEVMRLIVTWCLFSKRPMLLAEQITNSRVEFLSDANVDSWANMFGLKDKMRISQDKIQSLSAHEVRLYPDTDDNFSH